MFLVNVLTIEDPDIRLKKGFGLFPFVGHLPPEEMIILLLTKIYM